MNTYKQKNVMENAGRALKLLDEQIVGYEDQQRQVEDLVIDFLSTSKGQCCLLEGEPNCGRESVLVKVLDKYKLHLRVINVGYVAVDPTFQESLAREDDEGYSIFLIRDADELLTAHQQEFLYTMVDKATTFSWLVFFSVSRQNFSQSLEKRGNSRMPRIRITFEQTNCFKEYCDGFRNMLVPKNTDCENDSNYIQFINSLNIEEWMKYVFDKYNFDYLKQIAAQFLMRIVYFCDKENFVCWNEEDLKNIVEETIEFSKPNTNRRLLILKELPLRSQCVFLCVHRIVENREADTELLTPKTTYRAVFLEYKKLVNCHYSILNVTNYVYIFREIDRLVEVGLVRTDKNTNATNTSFRKVWLDIDPLTVRNSIGGLKLPLPVFNFFETILK